MGQVAEPVQDGQGGLGLPVLCGVGAVGDGAHGRGEFIYPDAVPTQTALVAGLLGRLTEPLRT